MTEHLLHARLVNAGGELIAEGPCWLDESAGQATLEPERELGAIQKERGLLRLELDSGRLLPVSDKLMIFRLGPRPGDHSSNGHRNLYRLRLIDHAQDAGAVGAAGEGAPASRGDGGLLADWRGETPAAR